MKLSRITQSKAVKTLYVLIVVILGITGCSNNPQQGLPGGAAPAVIELWHSLQGAEAEALAKQTQHIMDGHPEVMIKLEYIPENQMAGKGYQAQAGGEGPEIFLTSAEVLTKLFHQGALAPIAGGADPFPGLVAQFQYGEKDYAQPLATDIPLFYYRTDLAQLPANIADIPSTKGILAIPSIGSAILAPWWTGQGGKLLSNGQPTLGDPANLLFLQQLFVWRDAKLLVVDPNAWTQFVNGQAAYTLAWASQAKGLAQTIPWGGVLPTNLTAGQGQLLSGRTIGLANSSLKTTEANMSIIRLVEEELLSPDSQWALSQAGNRFPASMSFYKRSEAQSGVLQQVGQGLSKVWPLRGTAPEWKLIPIQDNAWQKVWSGVVPETALTEAQAEAVKALSQ
jgi:multiple sugar transport system substrate-binding protein